MKALLLLTAFALQGEWITTEGGARVCRLTGPIERFMTLQSDFCEDWQPGFPKVLRFQSFPFSQNWIRPVPGRGIQIHTERGWVP